MNEKPAAASGRQAANPKAVKAVEKLIKDGDIKKVRDTDYWISPMRSLLGSSRRHVNCQTAGYCSEMESRNAFTRAGASFAKWRFNATRQAESSFR